MQKTKVVLSLIGAAILSVPTFAATVFSENMGTTGASGEAIAVHTFQNTPTLTYTGTATLPDMRTTNASTGYSGASGSFNVFFSGANATGGFQISGVNTLSYESATLAITFGIRKNNNGQTGTADFTVETSPDGTTYTPLTWTALPTGAGSVGWYQRTTTGSIPRASNLRVRFRRLNNTNANEYRIDDVSLAGTVDTTAPTATVTELDPNPTNLDTVRYNVAFSESVGTSFTNADISVNTTLPSGATANITTSADPNYVVSVTANNGSDTGTLSVTLGTSVFDLASNAYAGDTSTTYTITPNASVGDWTLIGP